MRPNDAELQISRASSRTLTWCELSEKQLRRRVPEPLENGKPRSGLSAAARNLKSNEGLGDYGRAAQETAKLSSSIWKRATCPSTMVKVIAKGDSTIFPVAFSPREATANAA
jgi:hypothetical protein